MDQTTHDVRRANWVTIIKQCQERPEGVTVKQWLSDNGVKEKAYYYWLRKFRKEAYEQMQPMAAKDRTGTDFPAWRLSGHSVSWQYCYSISGSSGH